MFTEAIQAAQLRRVARSKAPIFIGPFRSEVGFECLYWLPWLAKWRERYQIDPSRLIAVSRGGASVWYGAGHSAELYDYAPVASFRRALIADSLRKGSVKQTGITAHDEAIIGLIAKDFGIRRYHVLHPSAMYRGLEPWWTDAIGLKAVVDQLAFGPLSVSHPPLELALPEHFVAVSFYARHTWTMDDERREWVSALVEGLAKMVPVVLLESGLHADDHIPFVIKGPNVLSTAPYCTPTNNLAVQSAVLAKSTGFVGTYGGMMQLAVRMRKPSVGFYTQFSGTAYAHKLLTEWLGVQQQSPVMIGRPEDVKFVQEAMQVTFVPAPSNRGSSVVK